MGLFSIKEGLRIFGDIEASVLTGDYNPAAGSGVKAAQGSLFLRKNGVTYKKTGPNDVDWQPYSEVEHGGLVWSTVNSATTLSKDRGYVVDAGSEFTLTMPATPVLGSRVGFATLGNAEDNNVTVDFAGNNFNGAGDNLVLDLNYAYVEFLYTGNAGTGWVLSNSDESGNIANIRAFIGNTDNADSGVPEYTENYIVGVGDPLEDAIDSLDIEGNYILSFIGKEVGNDMPTFSDLENNGVSAGYEPTYVSDDSNLFVSVAKLDEKLQETDALATAGVEWRAAIDAITTDDPTGKTEGAFSDDTGGIEGGDYWDETKWEENNRILTTHENAKGHIFKWNGSEWVDEGALGNYNAVAVKYDFLAKKLGQRDGAAYMMKEDGPTVIKIADFDLSTAATIKMAGGYSPNSGNVTSDDSIQGAIQKIDGNNDAQDSVLGTSQGDTHLGNIDWNILADETNVKAALELLDKTVFDNAEYIGRDATVADAMPNFSGLADNGMPDTYTPNYVSDADDLTLSIAKLDQALKDSAESMGAEQTTTGIETETTVGSYPVSGNVGAKFFVMAWDGSGNRYASEVYTLNNDSAVDFTEYGILLVGDPGMIEMSVVVEGGEVKLKAAPTSGTFTVKTQRNLIEM